MKRNQFVLSCMLVAGLLLAVLFALATPPEAQALPEYSAQTGEPCATCHISPSGGGVRTPRGQAWVGEGKPGAVPGLSAALEALGVRLSVDETDFTVVPAEFAPAEPLAPAPAPAQNFHLWVSARDGN